VGVTALVVILFILLVAILAPLLGADSRLDEIGRRRRLGHS
jgi:hypothetical protein